MLLDLTMPRIHDLADTVEVSAVHVRTGDAISPGTKFADVTVDLSPVAEQDCPPVSTFRIVLLERGWLRELRIAPGDAAAPGAVLALVATDAGDPPGAAPVRAARSSIAAIVVPRAAWDRTRE